MNRFNKIKIKFITYTLIFSFFISSFPSYAMNYTGEVWDYDNVTHTATYSCPRDETSDWKTYGYPAVVGVGTTIFGVLIEKGIWACTKLSCSKKIGEGLLWCCNKTGKGIAWCGKKTGHGALWCCEKAGKGTLWCCKKTGKGISWCCRQTGHGIQGAWGWVNEKWDDWRAQGGVHG